MIITFHGDGSIHSFTGYRGGYTKEKVEALLPIEGYGNYLIYDAETIERVWGAHDTGGAIQIDINEFGDPIGVITENGDSKPPSVETPQPQLTEIELLQLENAELWYEKMLLEQKMASETAALWYEIMTGGNA